MLKTISTMLKTHGVDENIWKEYNLNTESFTFLDSLSPKTTHRRTCFFLIEYPNSRFAVHNT